MEVNHKDCDGAHNAPSNLEVMTRQQNTAHAGANGLLGKKYQRGETNPSSKLDETAVRSILVIWRSGTQSQRQIAEAFGISQQTVSNIVHRRTWAHLSTT